MTLSAAVLAPTPVLAPEMTTSDCLDHEFCAECYPPPYGQHDVIAALCGRLRLPTDRIGGPAPHPCVVCTHTSGCARCGAEF